MAQKVNPEKKGKQCFMSCFLSLDTWDYGSCCLPFSPCLPPSLAPSVCSTVANGADGKRNGDEGTNKDNMKSILIFTC